MNGLTDQQLLCDYAERLSEPAFAELVQRHEQIAPQLDTALGELSDADRDAVPVRCFERKTRPPAMIGEEWISVPSLA